MAEVTEVVKRVTGAWSSSDGRTLRMKVLGDGRMERKGNEAEDLLSME